MAVAARYLPAGLKVIAAAPFVRSFDKSAGIWDFGNVDKMFLSSPVSVNLILTRGKIMNIVITFQCPYTEKSNIWVNSATVADQIRFVHREICSLSDVLAGNLVAWMIHNCSGDAVMFGQLPKSLKVNPN